MIVGIGGAEIPRHGELFLGGLRVFFAEIPVERQFVGEPRDQFPAIEFALRTQQPSIEGFGNDRGFPFVAVAIVVDLVFLKFKMEVQPETGRVVEYDLPLVEFGTVVVQLRVSVHKRPYVVAVASRVVGQARERIEPF